MVNESERKTTVIKKFNDLGNLITVFGSNVHGLATEARIAQCFVHFSCKFFKRANSGLSVLQLRRKIHRL
jgi:hypothetical protein